MKHLLYLAALLAPFALQGQTPEPADSVEGFVFTDVKIIPTTGVKDQNRSGTCWCFSGTSFIEDEILRQGGDSVHLSEMYTVRHTYKDKADKYVRMYGQCNFGPGGQCPDVTYVMERYGAVPEDAYPGLNYGEDKHSHNELDGVLTSYINTIVKRPNKKLSTAWQAGIDGILDAYLGAVPETFNYQGKTYTPQTYLQSLGINPKDYVPLTSFTHHPFYEPFILEVPDNWTNYGYINLPLDELKQVVDYAVENGYPIAWAADVSEPGFRWYDGVALMPRAKTADDLNGTELARWVKLSDSDREKEKYDFNGPTEEIVVTQELRQDMFDRQETTDDHGMEIVGYATDQNGKRYYKVKNSWATNQKYDGYLYVSEPYLLAKTIDIYVHRDAVPAAIAAKIGLK